MALDWFERMSHKIHITILLAASYGLLMWGNGLVSLTHPDEVFYIQSAKEMLAHRNWLTPMIFDDVQFEKPFLAYAMLAAAIKWFGLTPFASRFFPSVFGILGVGVTYWIGWILYKRNRLSVLSGWMISSSFIYIGLSRSVLTDMIFSVFVWLAIGSFCLGYYHRKHRNPGLIIFFIFMALAVLTKGILGILFPLTTVLMFLGYKKEIGFLRCHGALWGSLLFVVIALPWHLVMYLQHGQFFLSEYFYNVHWRRVLQAEHGRLDNWYFYIALLAAGITPWFLFWFPALKLCVTQFKQRRALREKLFFLLSWILAVYTCVQPAHSKLASYLFPVFPAIAILLACGIHELLTGTKPGDDVPLLRVIGWGMAGLLCAVAIGGVISGHRYIHILGNIAPVYMGASLTLSWALLIVLLTRNRRYKSMVASFAGVSYILLAIMYTMQPHIEPWISCKPICDLYQQVNPGDDQILSSKFYARGVKYYTGRRVAVIDINGKKFWSPHPIRFIDKDEVFIAYVNERPITWAILKEGNVADVHRILRHGDFKITQLGGFGGKYILKIEKIVPEPLRAS